MKQREPWIGLNTDQLLGQPVEIFTYNTYNRWSYLLTKHNWWSYLLTKHIADGVIYLQNI